MPEIIKYIDLCCGIGGFRVALNNFEKKQSKYTFKCILSSDIKNEAILTYNENFKESIKALDIYDINEVPAFDMLCAGFPCFVAGTKVLTSAGYKSIENIKNEKLITHTGEFRNILNLQRKVYSGDLYHLKLKYRPDEIICTPEHPFYVIEQSKVWNNSNKSYDKEYSKPEWKPNTFFETLGG